MITYIKGTIAEKNPAYLVVETAAGVAYQVHISLNTFSKLKEETTVKIFTHFVVKEDGQQLYGFFDEQERSVFRLLISVNGIGANTARLILSSLTVSELATAITSEDVRMIQSVKGIGAKTAQRVVIELKDKIGKTVQDFDRTSVQYGSSSRNEALLALTALGFAKAATEAVLDKIIKSGGANLSVEDLIKQALKTMNR